ncbi:transglutaminase [Pseudorhodoferax aquiterrae]|uniref:Transglutaminase n=1 Tax=Pseudorhodoferax aquiterrae TaxID=747304 RepID=A0ABQ3G182_9BURK|nr:transglutaminase family protein [Pseudorhodoferax aquiterrae]GHC80622.1 transglutaminase [Pseudorhodoferax aquiterrae]
MRLQVTHETRYDYTPAVETAQHVAHLQPRDTPSQRLLHHRLVVTPEPDELRTGRDVFGNTRSFFALQSGHEELRVLADSVVETRLPQRPPSPLAWEQVRDRFRYHAGGGYDAASEYLFPSPYVPRHADFMDYVRPSFTAGRPLLEATDDLMRRIHRDFEYASDSTEINTPAVQALAQRQGVCQDFAHIMVACLRMLGLPARYVSGYLLTQPPPGQPRLIGADASHAWVAVYVPDVPDHDGWYDFDPTNDRAPGEDYVTLAVGRDFSDVSPMRGVIHGGARHSLHVGVTVQPLAADAAQPEEIPA